MGYKEGSLKKDGTPRKKPGRQAKPKVKSTWVRAAPRPSVWKCGPDEYKHSMYHPYLLSRAQANFRGEEFTLTFEEYYDMWKDDWNNRGRKPDNMCMTRRDPEGAWSRENTYILTRREHLQIQGHLRKGTMTYKKNIYTKLKVS